LEYLANSVIFDKDRKAKKHIMKKLLCGLGIHDLTKVISQWKINDTTSGDHLVCLYYKECKRCEKKKYQQYK